MRTGEDQTEEEAGQAMSSILLRNTGTVTEGLCRYGYATEGVATDGL